MFEAGNAQSIETTLPVQRDWRADGGARRVKVTRGSVHIARRFSGVKMVISVPAEAYQGVVLEVLEGRGGLPCYRLSLAHRDRDLDVTLVENSDSGAAAAEWKAWASYFGLQRLVVNEDGALSPVDAAKEKMVGMPRRANASVRQRRPRFLTRRRPGDSARMESVFAEEREIIGYE